jgi:predicted MPP superfamily phosphohydrolase
MTWVLSVLSYFLIVEPVREAIAQARGFLQWEHAYGPTLILFWLNSMLAVIGLVLLLLKYVTGDFAYEATTAVPQLPGLFDQVSSATGSELVIEQQRFKSGHLCAKREAIPTRGGNPRCLSVDGTARRFRESRPEWTEICCVEVVPGSNSGTLAFIRRASVNYEFLSGFWWILSTVAAIIGGVLATLAVAGILQLLTAVILAFGIMSFSVGRGIRNCFMTLRQPNLVQMPNTNAASSVVVLAQLSDIHQTAADKVPVEIEAEPHLWRAQQAQPNGVEIRSRLRRLLKTLQSQEVSTIAITGDLTDRSEHDEWNVIRSELDEHLRQSHGSRLLLLPGNHDVSLTSREQPDPFLRKRKERLFRANTHLRHYWRRISNDERDASSPEADLFPARTVVAISHPIAEVVHVIALDSNRYRSHNALSGAMGKLGRKQVNEFRAILNEISGPVVVLVHHHVGLSPSEARDVRGAFSIALDGYKLLHPLREYARKAANNRVLILHGHKHRELRLTDNSGIITIFGIPSSTLGAEVSGMLDGAPRFALVRLSLEGQWIIMLEKVVTSRSRGPAGSS